jgi:hypothetical protein
VQKLGFESGLDYAAAQSDLHIFLRLAPSYEEFLSGLGGHTRKNFRYYRRKFEADGHTYVPNVPLRDFCKGAQSLIRKGVVGASQDRGERFLAMLERARRSILVGLRHKDGSWLSLLGGWFEGSQPLLLFQLNSDIDHSRASLSIVLRGYFIEQMIEMGARSLIVWGGTRGPLSRYAIPIPSTSVYLDKRHFLWSATRKGLASVARKLPTELAWRAEWVLGTGCKASEASGGGGTLEAD